MDRRTPDLRPHQVGWHSYWDPVNDRFLVRPADVPPIPPYGSVVWDEVNETWEPIRTLRGARTRFLPRYSGPIAPYRGWRPPPTDEIEDQYRSIRKKARQRRIFLGLKQNLPLFLN